MKEKIYFISKKSRGDPFRDFLFELDSTPEMDVIPHKALGGHLKHGVLEPQLLVELPQQVLPEVDHLRGGVLFLVYRVELGRALSKT